MAKKNEMSADDKFKELMENIKDGFGEEAVREGLTGGILECDTISTGSISLDYALGVGGVPKGRVIEVFGPESSGKTTLATHIVANCQKSGLRAGYIDLEHAVDPTYTKNLGVDMDKLVFSQPDCAEDAMKLVELMVDSGLFGIVVIDSVAALTTRAELDGEIGDHHIGAVARLMSQTLKKLVAKAHNTETCVLFINQIREKIGTLPGQKKTDTSGGRALKFYSSVRMEINRTGTEWSGKAQSKDRQALANATTVKVVKNKVAPPFRNAQFQIVFGKGISKEIDIIVLGAKHKILGKSGSWYSYKDVQIGNGLPAAAQFLEENEDIRNEIEGLIKDKLFKVVGKAHSEDIKEESEEE